MAMPTLTHRVDDRIARQAVECNRLEIGMPAVRIIAALLIGFFLLMPHAALAQVDEAAALNQQVIQLYSQGRYSEAIPLAQRALVIVKKARQDHPDVASAASRNDALEQALKINAEIVKLFNVGRYADAIPLAQLELAIYEKVLGPNHLDVATSLNTLAFFYEKQGRYADADPFYKRAAAIREKALGPDDPFVGSLLSTLAAIYNNQKRDTEAEPLQKRALEFLRKHTVPTILR